MTMSSQVLPAIGNRFFVSGGGFPNEEIRLYQCIKKQKELGYECLEKTVGDGMLLLPEAKIVGVPGYFPKQLDPMILKMKLFMN